MLNNQKYRWEDNLVISVLPIFWCNIFRLENIEHLHGAEVDIEIAAVENKHLKEEENAEYNVWTMEDGNLYLYCEDRRERTRGHGARPHPRQLILISPAQPGLPLLLLLRGQRRVAPPRHAPLHRRLCQEGTKYFWSALQIFLRACAGILLPG